MCFIEREVVTKAGFTIYMCFIEIEVVTKAGFTVYVFY
jgi:hypothetical protein